MKRRIAGLILMMSCLPVSAFAKNIEPSQIVPNNYERLETALMEGSNAGNTLKDVAGNTPSTYDYRFESSDGKSSILADNVPVTLPEGDEIPAYHVSSGVIPQELADRLYEYFFPDGAFQWTGTVDTKESIEQFIQHMEEEIERLETEQTFSSEEEKTKTIQKIERMIEEQRGLLDEAPEESTLRLEPKDSVYTVETYDDLGKMLQELVVVSEDETQCLSVISSDPYNGFFPLISYTNEAENSFRGYGDGVPIQLCSDEDILGIGISLEEAETILEDFLSKMEVDASIREVFCVKGDKLYSEHEWANDEIDGPVVMEDEQYTAFRFVLTRNTNGIANATTYNYYQRDMYDENYFEWFYEHLDVIVNSNGIVYLKWECPLSIEDTVSENANIISFEDAAGIFEQIMPIKMEEEFDRDYIELKDIKSVVTDVKLELIRVRKCDTDRTGLLIPAWVYYGDYDLHYVYDYDGTEYYGSEPKPWILMAINAIDGSVIDIVEGY